MFGLGITRNRAFRRIVAACGVASGLAAVAQVDGDTAARPAATAVVARGAAVSPAPANPQVRVDPRRELLITDLSVVEDPVRTSWAMRPLVTTLSTRRIFGRPASTALATQLRSQVGAWTFGKLMMDMAGANDPSTFTLRWLETWERDQTVNGFTVAARPSIRPLVIEPWLRASGGARLDLEKAPFRLLAIVNRLDLRRSPSYAAGNAGEGRFVFGVLDPNGNPLPFTVIFEFEQPARTSTDVKGWAQSWHALGAVPFGGSFNAALQAITNRFAGRGAAPAKPNGSALNQIRTNEIAIGPVWELREFVIDRATGFLATATTKQSPDISFNGTPDLAAFINANEAAVLSGRHAVPPAWLGGADPARFIWQAPGIRNPEARHALALNTCSGCHFRETETPFTHVFTRGAGQEAGLSDFLTGNAMPKRDPISNAPHTFGDLGRRADDLRRVLASTPTQLAVEAPATAVH